LTTAAPCYHSYNTLIQVELCSVAWEVKFQANVEELLDNTKLGMHCRVIIYYNACSAYVLRW